MDCFFFWVYDSRLIFPVSSHSSHLLLSSCLLSQSIKHFSGAVIIYSRGNNGQCLSAFNPVGKQHVPLPACALCHCGAWCTAHRKAGFSQVSVKARVFWVGVGTCWSGMNWLAHRVPDRKTQMPEEQQQQTGEPDVLSHKPSVPCAHCMACPEACLTFSLPAAR